MNKLTKILATATLIISMGLFPGCNSKPQEAQKMQPQKQPDLSSSQQAMLDVFQQHMNAEMTGDIEATMAKLPTSIFTGIRHPYLCSSGYLM